MSIIVNELTQMANALKAFGQDPSLYSVVLAHGREYEPGRLPAGVDLAEPKQCFQNALDIADDDELVYTEGYFLRPGAPMLIHHAWCVTPAKTVVDPTIPDAADCAYYGIEFQVDWVIGLGYLGVALERYARRLADEGRL